MKQKFDSFEELMSRCGNSELKHQVSSILSDDKYIKWNFMSASMDGEVCRSEFTAPAKAPGWTHRLSCTLIPRKETRHYSICGLTPAQA